MNDDFPPRGKEKVVILERWRSEDEARRRGETSYAEAEVNNNFRLVEEQDGSTSGNVYIVRGHHGHLVWSPDWRSDVPASLRCTHVGVTGEATCIGWSDSAHLAPLIRTPRLLGECGPDQASVEALLLASGVKVRPRGEEARPAVLVSSAPPETQTSLGL